ncbi:BREX system P-loop protein BrxC [Cardiobacteriaceae bacterium TAE3-ERU3]|nr:BREX system P-loop protein BrxC [Cardiobacteriaceae bacterium TAE3-ERU3]
MMILNEIFLKEVNRPIEGVIKADDEASLRLEIEEYVLTNEVEKRLESFLDAYNNYEGANGVWVSGFFGSGKSHLLKMLALLLENRQIDGASALDLFLPKCDGNALLSASLKRAVALPSKSILFNIDQKADVISKTQVDALLAVFVKVFDEMCGYYGKQGHIAQFERELDSRGLYEEFKLAYESIAGRTWQKGREQALLEAKNIAKAYAQVTGDDETSAMGILDKYRSQYHVSIEDFAEQVHAYIEKQPANFRLNFFVDEVGQYIAENVKLMTNLQTIAESLATKCRGRAWVIVTAQEDMNTVVGEMGKQQSNDFSKIQARFANRMKLTSADVSEVIQKRLLMKTEQGEEILSGIYDEQRNNFKTLFDFADGSQTYRNYQDLDSFTLSYPFIPYQFALFQSAIQSLSEHNAFEGKHSSVGERSMLGVFQQVAIQIGGHQIGQLATFDLMFEGIRTTLKSNIQRAIIQAENHLDAPFAIRLLKALFLVKYVKEFKSTIRNLCVLMLDSFKQDLPALRKQVEDALNLLEQQTYIQRNGETYEYLTDEEKDIEQEIKNTDVETSDVIAELEKIIFEQVIRPRKIRYDENGQDYPFSRKIDEKLYGRGYELAIHIISPYHEHADNEKLIKINSSYKADELFVLMPADDRLVSDLLMYKRADKYIRQNFSITQQEAIKRILSDKGTQNQQRHAELKERIQNLLGKAKLFVEGSDIDMNPGDAQTRIVRGFNGLIASAYPNLRMLRNVAYSESDIAKLLKSSQGELLGEDTISALPEPEQEILAFIQRNQNKGERTTLKKLLEQFERKPYGWSYAAVLCTLAKLCMLGKVEVRSDGNLLEDEKLEKALRNNNEHSNIILEPQIEFTASQIRTLKAFFEDFFDKPPQSSEAKPLGQETASELKELVSHLDTLTTQTGRYPFLYTLKPVLEKLNKLTGKSYTWYLGEFLHEEDELFEMKENIIDPILKFMNGSQKAIYDSTREFIATQKSNFPYINSDESKELENSLSDPECFKASHIQQMKAQVEILQAKVDDQIKIEIDKAKEAISVLNSRLCGMPEFKALEDEQQAQLMHAFDEFNKAIEGEKLIAVIRDNHNRFEENTYRQLLIKMESWTKSETVPESSQTDRADKSLDQKASTEIVHARNVSVSFGKALLSDEADVEQYLNAMRETLLEEIRKGKRIQI